MEISYDNNKDQDDINSDLPLTDEEFERGRVAMLVRNARGVTGLGQVEFAKRYNIPVGTVRDWEQGRTIPDKATQGYLKVIAALPNDVAKIIAA